MDKYFTSNLDLHRKLFPSQYIDWTRLLVPIPPVMIESISTSAASVDLFKQVSRPAEELAHQMVGFSEAISKSSHLTLEVPSLDFFFALPTLDGFKSTFDRLVKMMGEGESVLTKAGHSYAVDVVVTMLFADLAQTPKEELAAKVTEALNDHSRAEWFKQALQERVASSDVMVDRWPIIERGLTAHYEGDYIVSVSVLLPQFEGLLEDTMILRNLAERDGDNRYLLDPATKKRLKTRKRNEDRKIVGLRDLIDQSEYKNSTDMKNLASFVADSLCQDRNAVLHGYQLDYARIDFSVSLVLLISAMVGAIAELEQVAAK